MKDDNLWKAISTAAGNLSPLLAAAQQNTRRHAETCQKPHNQLLTVTPAWLTRVMDNYRDKPAAVQVLGWALIGMLRRGARWSG